MLDLPDPGVDNPMNLISRLSVRERGLLFLTAGVIGSALGIRFVLDPLITRWKQTGRSLSSLALRLEKDRRLLTQRERIQERFSQATAQVKMEGSEEEVMASFLSLLEQIAGRASLPLKELRPRPVTSQRDFHLFLAEVSAEGKMDQMTRFLYELQSSGSPLKVERLQLAVKGGSSEEAAPLEIRLTVSTLRISQ